MDSRNFSDRIQYRVVLLNLEKNKGQIKCEICGKSLMSKSECHFDHIMPFAKGGKSSLENCQILCNQCNLKKNDKELNTFIFEEQARKVIFGDGVLENKKVIKNDEAHIEKQKISKEDRKNEIIVLVKEFVAKNGDIKKVDLSRTKNNLPTITEINKVFGGLKEMKLELAIDSGIQEWNRERILEKLSEWVEIHGDIIQSELTTKNKLPSLPCILKYCPEASTFSEVKMLLGLNRTREEWSKEKALKAGKEFITKYGKDLKQKNLCKEYNLPSNRVIERYFGNINNFKKAIGANTVVKNRKIDEEEVTKAIELYFGSTPRKITNRSSFLDKFEYSYSGLQRKFGSIDEFLRKYEIIETEPKKYAYTKDEIDKLIIDFIKKEKTIPTSSKQLKQFNLPSVDTICRYYETWNAPFIYFMQILEKTENT